MITRNYFMKAIFLSLIIILTGSCELIRKVFKCDDNIVVTLPEISKEVKELINGINHLSTVQKDKISSQLLSEIMNGKLIERIKETGIYNITTAENGLVFFSNEEPAYITKRFDVNCNGTKLGNEDYASLAGKTEENVGENFRYDYSYEGIAELIKEHVGAWKIEMEKFYNLVVFNFLYISL